MKIGNLVHQTIFKPGTCKTQSQVALSFDPARKHLTSWSKTLKKCSFEDIYSDLKAKYCGNAMFFRVLLLQMKKQKYKLP
jgi:hypothetical protein